MPAPYPERNQRCPCGSGEKYKHCCGRNDRRSFLRLLQNARLHHEAGRLAAAAAIYERILQIDSRQAETLHCLGILAAQVEQNDTAVQFFQRAIAANPANPHFYNSLGNLFLKRQLFPEAASAYESVLQLQPEHVDALSNLGIALQAQGKTEEAIVCYRKALARNPSQANAHNNLGNLHLSQGNLEAAKDCYQRAIALRPDYADAHYNLGNTLQQRGQYEAAVSRYRRALACNPSMPQAHNNLGVTLRHLGRREDAIASFRQAIAIQRDYADACNNLGVALQEQGRLEAAIQVYRGLLSVQPDYADAYYNLGSAFHDLGKIDFAVASYQTALAVSPAFLSAYSNLLYLHASTRDIPPEAERELAAGWEKAALSDAEREAARNHRFPRAPRTGRRLRLGILSAEIGDHAVAEFLEPLLTHLDRSRVHVSLFPTVVRSGERAARLRHLADSWNPLTGIPDREAAELIRSREIDVLMDTTGHTRHCRLGIIAHRAAPVQFFYAGYWSTTGLTEMDWVISDDYLPRACDAHFCERVWRLPRLAVTYQGDPTLPQSQWRAASDGTIWLGSFNQYFKMREATFDLWAKVMQAIPESKLLLEDRTADASDHQARIELELATRGVTRDRLAFEPFVPTHERHMALYDRIDIALDTIPFNSGTTACDALWMGVPLVALEGDWSGGRMASTFLRAIGRPEWVAGSESEYVAIVAQLARNGKLRKTLRSTQRARMMASPLCDGSGLARALTEAFAGMFDQWVAKVKRG